MPVSIKVLTDAPGHGEKSSKEEKAQVKNKKKKTPTKLTAEKEQGKNEERNAHSSNPERCGGTSMHTKEKKNSL